MPLSPVSKNTRIFKVDFGCFQAFGNGGHASTPLPLCSLLGMRKTPVQNTTGTAVLGISKDLDGFEKPR